MLTCEQLRAALAAAKRWPRGKGWEWLDAEEGPETDEEAAAIINRDRQAFLDFGWPSGAAAAVCSEKAITTEAFYEILADMARVCECFSTNEYVEMLDKAPMLVASFIQRELNRRNSEPPADEPTIVHL